MLLSLDLVINEFHERKMMCIRTNCILRFINTHGFDDYSTAAELILMYQNKVERIGEISINHVLWVNGTLERFEFNILE